MLLQVQYHLHHRLPSGNLTQRTGKSPSLTCANQQTKTKCAMAYIELCNKLLDGTTVPRYHHEKANGYITIDYRLYSHFCIPIWGCSWAYKCVEPECHRYQPPISWDITLMSMVLCRLNHFKLELHFQVRVQTVEPAKWRVEHGITNKKNTYSKKHGHFPNRSKWYPSESVS